MTTERPWIATYRRFGIPLQPAPIRHRSVTAMLEAAMQRYGDKAALICGAETLSYAAVDAASRSFAAWLQAQGVKRGDRIAVMLPNVNAFPVAMLGITRAGAAQVNVNPLYTPRELEHQLNDAGCETIVVFDGATPTLAEVIGKTPVRRVITAGLTLSSPASAAPTAGGRLAGAVSLPEVIALGATLPFTPVALGPEDLLFLQYTGGTTGLSKGAALTHANLLANVAQFAAFMPNVQRPGEEVVVTAVPLYHIMALMVNFISYFALGAENWLVPNPRDMDGFVATLAKARPTIFIGVNTLYAGLVAHPALPDVDWSRLTLAAGGGAAMMGAVSDRWQRITGKMIREGYGLSETSPIVSFNPAAVDHFTATTGLPMPGCDVRLLDEDGRDVAEGQSGEVCVKGPQVMGGYWQKPEANAAAFTPDGYFKTGDVGEFDAQGFLKIVDRKKDMIIVSGFNVYPNEIEAVVTECAGVAECACVGTTDPKTGEAVKLFVVRARGSSMTEAELIAHCRARMTAYKVPKIIRFVETLPKSTVGKILRRELRDVA